MWVNIDKIDIYAGMREAQLAISGPNVSEKERLERLESLNEIKHQDKTPKGILKRVVTSCF